jgi:hypothetical protein
MGYSGGTRGVPRGYCGGTRGVLGRRRGSEVRLHVRVFARVLVCVFVFICVRVRCVRARVSVRVCVPV